MVSFDEVVRQDIKLLFSVQDFCSSNPRFDSFMRSMVSKYPHQDVVLALYLLFVFALIETGHNHFWLCLINLSGAFLCRKLIASKRPVEYNRSLMPIADIAAESYGFPSLESHMSIVILGHLIIHYKSTFIIPPAVMLIGLIGFSRVYAKSRFVHQVIASWITGLLGLFLGLYLCSHFNFDRMVKKNYLFFLFGGLGGLLCHFALCAENNDSRLMYVSRSEYVRVLSEIINPPVETTKESTPVDQDEGDEEDDNDERTDSHRVRFLPEDTTPDAQTIRKRKISQHKRDSFFFLQRALERRSGQGVSFADNSNSNTA